MVNDADGSEYPSRGVFVEVAEPEKLVWTEPDFGFLSSLDRAAAYLAELQARDS